MPLMPWNKKKDEQMAEEEAVKIVQDEMEEEQKELGRRLRLLQAQVSLIQRRNYNARRRET